MNKEEKSKEYAELKVRQYDKNNTIEKYGMYRAMQQCNFDGFDIQEAFDVGWDEALKSQWVKVDDKLPNDLEKVLLASLYEREILYSVGYMFNGKWVTSNNKPFAWMQIPSFDNILEYNKDSLK